MNAVMFIIYLSKNTFISVTLLGSISQDALKAAPDRLLKRAALALLHTVDMLNFYY